MELIFNWFGLGTLWSALMNALQWMPSSCLVLISIVFSVFCLVVIGRIFKFIWDVLPFV